MTRPSGRRGRDLRSRRARRRARPSTTRWPCATTRAVSSSSVSARARRCHGRADHREHERPRRARSTPGRGSRRDPAGAASAAPSRPTAPTAMHGADRRQGGTHLRRGRRATTAIADSRARDLQQQRRRPDPTARPRPWRPARTRRRRAAPSARSAPRHAPARAQRATARRGRTPRSGTAGSRGSRTASFVGLRAPGRACGSGRGVAVDGRSAQVWRAPAVVLGQHRDDSASAQHS